MASSVVVDLLGRDQLNPVLQAGEKAVQQFGVSTTAIFQTVGVAIAGALSVGLIKEFAMSSIEAAQESEEAWAKWEATQRAAGDAVRLTSEQLDTLAAELQKVTRFEDEAVVNAASLLSIYENLNSEAFERTIRLSADMASLFGTDLEGAARQLGRALDDPVQGLTQLRRAGVVLNEETKELVKSLKEQGRTVEAQNVLFDVLEKKFNGLAEAMGETSTGKIAKLNNALGELKEKLGALAVPAIGGFVDQLNKELSMPITVKWMGKTIFSTEDANKPVGPTESQKAEEKDAAEWQRTFDAMQQQEAARKAAEKSAEFEFNLWNGALNEQLAKGAQATLDKQFEDWEADLKNVDKQKTNAKLNLEDEKFSASFEDLTGLNRRITQAAASGSPMQKVEDAVKDASKQQIDKMQEVKPIWEEMRDHLRNLDDPTRTTEVGLA